jgi:HlyD family secretion protein
MKKLVKYAVGLALLAAVVLALVRAYRGSPVLVDTSVVARGPLQVTVDDDGRTRVRDAYTISAPIAGRLVRVALDPGDQVLAGETVVAEFQPVDPGLLDARSKAEAEARLGRAEAAVKEAEAREGQADADLAYAEAELARVRELHSQGLESRDTLDQAQRNEQRLREGRRAAEFGRQVARYELELARASLIEDRPAELSPEDGVTPMPVNDGRMMMRSPIDGSVLRVFERSSRPLTVGAPILEVGSTSALEIVAEYLSQDAVKIRPGMRVLIEGWGGELPDGSDRTLEGVVRLVEPAGFTKVSALGVEEQRVNVIVDPTGDPQAWSSLGDGYRVELRIVLLETDDVLVVPTGALFREGGDWAVFAVEGEVAVKRKVQIGNRNGLEAEVTGGLAEGERVVLYPSELVGDGTRVEAR